MRDLIAAVTSECVDCGHDFNIDSTPDEDRCWEGAELADAEADR